MKISENENVKALLIWVLMCLGLSISIGIVIKLFTPKPPHPPITTINHYFIGNKEVNYGLSK